MRLRSGGTAGAIGTAIAIFLVSMAFGTRPVGSPLTRLSAALSFAALAFAVVWTLDRFV